MSPDAVQTPDPNAEPRHDPMEWVDERNVVQGVLSRGEVHDRGLRHRSAHVAIFDADGRLYLHKRSASKSILPHHWDISSAGHVEPGEPYREAAARELREELGVSGVAIEPLHVSDATEAVGWEFASLWHGRIDDPDAIVPDPSEIAEGRFFAPREIVARLANPENKIAGTLALALTALVERADDIPAMATWSAEERRAVASAAMARPEHPDGAAPHAPSMAMLLEAEKARGGIMPGVQRWLRRSLFLLAWLALAAVALAVPIQFSNERMERFLLGVDALRDSGGAMAKLEADILDNEVAPWIYGGLNPLPTKEAAVALISLAGLPLLLALLLLRPATPLRRQPIPLLLFLFATWCAVSWRFVLPPDWNHWGLYAAMRLGTFLALLAMAATTLDRRGAQKRMVLLGSIPLALLCLLSIQQHLRHVGALPGFLSFALMPPGSYERQLMASTIGHNNGVASVALYLWFPCLAAIFLARSWKGRVAAAAGAVALAMMFLWLQTRAIWAVLALLTPLFAWMAAKEAGWRPRPVHVLAPLALLAALMFAQTVDRPWNPLRANPPLVQRLKQLSPTTLKQSTQVRIAAISLRYMPKSASRFLFGNGVGSFAAVYPHMQKEYFLGQPAGAVDLHLPSSRRTAQAHSDALQVFIELGFVGLSLLLAFLWFFAKKLESAWEAAPTGRDRVWLLAIATPICGTIIHGFVDFPFHVASTMTYFCVYLGMLLAAEKAWGGRAPSAPVGPNALQRALSDTGRRGGVVRVATLVALLGLYIPLGYPATFAMRELMADVYRKDAKSRSETYLLDPDLNSNGGGYNILRSVRRKLQQAFRLNPDDPETLMYRGHIHSLISELALWHYRRAKADGLSGAELEPFRLAVEQHSVGAINETEASQVRGNEYFRTHFDIALANQRLARIASTDAERARFETTFELEMRAANLFHPGDSSILLQLLQLYVNERPIDDPEVAYWRAMLRQYDPDLYRKVYVGQLHEDINNRRWGSAARYLACLQFDEPTEPAHAYAAVLLACRQRSVDAARASLAEARRRFPAFPLDLDYAMLPELTAKNWEGALEIVERALAEKPEPQGRDRAMLEAIQAYCMETLGLDGAAEAVAAVEAKAREEAAQDEATMLKRGHWGIRHLDGVVNTLCVYFGELKRAKPFLEMRAAFDYPSPDSSVSVWLARIAFDEGDVDTASRHLKQALVAMPSNRDAHDLIAQRLGADSDAARALVADAASVRDARMKAMQAREFARLQEEQGF